MNKKLSLPLWHYLLLSILLACAIYATESLVSKEKQHARSLQLRHEIASAGQLRALIESELNIPLYLTIGLTAYVQARDGNISASEIHLFLPELVHQTRHIRNISIAPNNTVNYIYPKIGNEDALGIYYPDLKEQWPDIASIIKQKEARLTGPISLVQGGTAFIYRLPVYTNAKDYWGMISTVVDIDSLWRLLAQQAAAQEVNIAIRSLSTSGRTSDAFYGDERLFHYDNMILTINLRGALWQMAMQSHLLPKNRTTTIRAYSYGASVLMLGLLAWLLASRQRLRASLFEQKNSKLYLRCIMDNVDDAIITTSTDGVIEQVNLSTYTLFGYNPCSLQGLHWNVLLADPLNINEVYNALEQSKNEYETIGLKRDNSHVAIGIRKSHIRLQRQDKLLFVFRDLSTANKAEKSPQ